MGLELMEGTVPNLLNAFASAAESHEALDEVLAAGTHPAAECRVNPNTELPYEVWDGPDPWVAPPPSPPAAHTADTDTLLDALAERLLARMKEGM